MEPSSLGANSPLDSSSIGLHCQQCFLWGFAQAWKLGSRWFERGDLLFNMSWNILWAFIAPNDMMVEKSKCAFASCFYSVPAELWHGSLIVRWHGTTLNVIQSASHCQNSIIYIRCFSQEPEGKDRHTWFETPTPHAISIMLPRFDVANYQSLLAAPSPAAKAAPKASSSGGGGGFSF